MVGSSKTTPTNDRPASSLRGGAATVSRRFPAASKYSTVVECARSTSANTTPNPVTCAGVVDPATTKSTSIASLPICTNRRGGLKTLNSPAYSALTSVKPLSLTRKPVPLVVNSTPRVDLVLKKLPGNVSVLVNAAGTPSQLISRRPAAGSPAVPPLRGSPSRVRYCATAGAMSPVALTIRASPFFFWIFCLEATRAPGVGAFTDSVPPHAPTSSAPTRALHI